MACAPLAAVTGGARGIGAAYVDALLGRGYRVAVLDVSGAVEAAAARGSDAVAGFHCDVTDKHSFRSAFDAALAWGGAPSFSVFVCNAGILGTLFSDADRVVGVNLMGAIHGCEMAIKAATRSLSQPADPPLSVVITASTNGLVPADSDLAPVYVATKFGLVGLVRSLQPLGSRLRVRVNAVAPVTVDTPMVDGLLPDAAVAFLQREGRGGVLPPQACAAALLGVLDDESLCGEVVVVHPDAPGGRGFATEPLAASAWLGAWRDSGSAEVAAFVDEGLQAAASGVLPAWSGV